MKRSDKPSGMTTTGKTREAVIVFFARVAVYLDCVGVYGDYGKIRQQTRPKGYVR
jgi:hypothetical protein